MNAGFKQDTRLGKLHTAGPPDVLVLLRVNGTEYVNELFEYSVEALSKLPALNFDKMLGTHATVELSTIKDGPRFLDGIITDVVWAGVGENGFRYNLTLRPWFWLAGKRRNQRIFHDKSIPEIVKDVLKPYAGMGEPAYSADDLQATYPKLEYTVQYRESDLDFVRRLLERAGINFYFTHVRDSHTMVLTDTVEAHPDIPGGVRKYIGTVGHHQPGEEHFWEWHPGRGITTGAIRTTDFNFKKPDAAMELNREGTETYAHGQLEAYDFPGDYLEAGAGKSVARLRLDQEQHLDHRHTAFGDCAALAAGMVVELDGQHSRKVKGQKYVCLASTTNFTAESYGTVKGAASDGFAYTGSYVMMPVTAPLVPVRRTRVPVMAGPQTATVVGEGEIDCDEFGRILVHFPWDLEKAYSMRCRVSQNWASKGWGGMVIPRIGMEVVVDFIEGNPDWPLVTGCVYNGRNDVPYELPKHKTRSTFRTDTHQGTGFNELRFEDQSGREEIYLHAERDQILHIKNNRAKQVMGSQVETVVGNHQSEIGKNSSVTVDGNLDVKVGFDFVNASLQKATSLLLTAGRELSGRLRNRVDFAARLRAPLMGKGSYRLSVANSKTETVGVLSSEQVGATKASAVAGQRIDVTGGDHRVKVVGHVLTKVGGMMSIDAKEGWILTSGKSSITLNPDGTIKITGVQVEITGDRLISAKSDNIDLN